MTSPLRNYQYFAAISATPDNFNLDAGLYGALITATTWGTVTLNKLMPDGSTYEPVATWAANGYQQIHLPAGNYQLALSGAAGVTGEIAKIISGARR